MEYQIHTITAPHEIEQQPVLFIDRFHWTQKVSPRAFGAMAYLPEKGLYLSMTTEEEDPKRDYENHQDPVYKDSAMEVFLTLEEPSEDCLYLNFEFNANGALLAHAGRRPNREPIHPEELAATEISAEIFPESWRVRFFVPNMLLARLYGVERLQPEDKVHCNFYKISESPEIEHYASAFPIHSDTPNFHRPQDFGTAVIR